MADADNSTILPKNAQTPETGNTYGYPSERGSGAAATNPTPTKGSPVNNKSAK